MKVFKEKNNSLNYRIWLSEELLMRCKKNPNYSLRAFSILLKLHSSTLSQLLSGKRNASVDMIKKLCEILKTDSQTETALINFIEEANPTSDISEKRRFKELTDDAFAIIADWYHYALLELTFITKLKNDPEWIGEKLGISPEEASDAVERLIRLDLFHEADGHLLKTTTALTNFSEGVTSEALKSLQRQILQKGLEAIDNTPQEAKDITSMTMAINEDKLPEARKILKQCRRDVANLLESGKQTRVYHLGLQLYPVSESLR